MALGGGTFTVQNKTLPGAYINFVSLKNASATLADRGIATIALELDWGADDTILEVTNGDFQKKSLEIFGYPYTDIKLKGLRDLFANIKTLYLYRLNSGGTKATSIHATAKYGGTRGNDLTVAVQANVDEPEKHDVITYLKGMVVDKQTVTTSAELVPNDFVTWKSFEVSSTTAGTNLSGGTNGKVTSAEHQKYLDKIESYAFNTMGCVSDEDEIKGLYVNFCKRMRDEVGAKFQLVVHNKKADYEGVINVKNDVKDSVYPVSSAVYWVTGVSAGCAVNRSNLNRKYDGEFEINVDYTQSELEKALKAGEFTFHRVGADVRVLEDINSLTTFTDDKGEIFDDNQTVRVIDQIANDIAVLFNTRYLGVVPNDDSGRISLWADISKHHKTLEEIRAISNWTGGDEKLLTVVQGDSKKSVVVNDVVTVTHVMAQLYMTVTVA